MAKQAHQVGDESFCRGMQERGLELSHLTPCWASQCLLSLGGTAPNLHIASSKLNVRATLGSTSHLLPLMLNLRPLTPGSASQGRLRTWLTGSQDLCFSLVLLAWLCLVPLLSYMCEPDLRNRAAAEAH